MPSDRINNLLERGGNGSTPPPAPPPVQPLPRASNPYSFITDQAIPAKKSLLPNGGSMKSRILIIAAGAVGLIILVVIVLGLIGKAGSGVKDDYQSLLQQQTELIRIADIGTLKAKSTDTKALAATTKLALLSEQPNIFKFAKTSGALIDAKTLALGKNTKTDAQLTAAAGSNQFDEVFTKIIQQNLQTYQQTLKKIYNQTSNKTTKAVLAKNYSDVGKLLGIPATKS